MAVMRDEREVEPEMRKREKPSERLSTDEREKEIVTPFNLKS